MTEIAIEDIKRIIDRLLDHIKEARGIEAVEIKSPFYWDIPADQRYNMNTDVSELNVGSLDDDWEFVSKLLDPAEVPLSNQLTEVAPLLRYIGETLGAVLAKDGG